MLLFVKLQMVPILTVNDSGRLLDRTATVLPDGWYLAKYRLLD
jgi:hypothetical protein